MSEFITIKEKAFNTLLQAHTELNGKVIALEDMLYRTLEFSSCSYHELDEDVKEWWRNRNADK